MGRALAFSDDEIIRLATEEYIAVTGDDWYQRRRRDAEGDFFRRVVNQNPHKAPEGQSRQGLYCFTASGKLLAYKNHQDAESVREMLEQGLAAWNRLPNSVRRPGVVKVPEPGKLDARYTRTPPVGGLVLNVFTRILDRDRQGKCVKGSCSFAGGDLSARDHLWLKQGEWRRLVPATAKKGDQFEMPATVAERLLCYHLVDNTRGEPPFWASKDIRAKRLTWTVVQATAQDLRLRLDGNVLLATNENPAKARRGYEARLLGYLHYDRVRKIIDRLDVVAFGDHWGEGEYTPGARPGRKPLGIALELSAGKQAADRVPPEAARDLEDYLGRDR
ncbi:MAG TPA: hypothetical protein VN688_04210 [Gemmataceae bacterium]|nr:hypothetical protein [Gemmataceae bacterium]